MKLCYQVATPDVAVAPSVTAFQGSLEHSFSHLAGLGYDGVELMTLDPEKLDWQEVKDTAEKYRLDVVLVCTGEIFGQLNLSFTNPEEGVRQEAIRRVNKIIEFAAFLGANVNIGRVRGQYCDQVSQEQSDQWAVEAFRSISDHAAPLGVQIALETVTIMQTNFINTLAEAAQMIDTVARDNFKVMMDVFHLNLEEKHVIDAIHAYASYNIHVHLADNNRRYPGHCGLDFKKILQAFHEDGYDGAFSMEIYQIPDQEGAAKGAMEYLAPICQSVYGWQPKKR